MSIKLKFLLPLLAAALCAEFAQAQRPQRTHRRSGPRVVRSCAPRHHRVRVWIPASTRVEQIPARWGFRYDSCGHRIRFRIEPARRRIVHVPGRWEWRSHRHG